MLAMNQIKSIRTHVGLTQAKFGDCIGCTQSAVGQFERGESDPTIEKATRIIDLAHSHGLPIQLEHIYGLKPLPEKAVAEQPAPVFPAAPQEA